VSAAFSWLFPLCGTGAPTVWRRMWSMHWEGLALAPPTRRLICGDEARSAMSTLG
jgi:hypothetical protein